MLSHGKYKQSVESGVLSWQPPALITASPIKKICDDNSYEVLVVQRQGHICTLRYPSSDLGRLINLLPHTHGPSVAHANIP